MIIHKIRKPTYTVFLLLITCLVSFLSPLNAHSGALSGWIKQHAEKLAEEVGKTVDKTIDETIGENEESGSVDNGSSSSKHSGSGGGLKPTAVNKGAPVKAVSGLSQVEERVIVPGDDLFKPISGLTLHGLPMIFAYKKEVNQRAYLKVIGLKRSRDGKYFSPAGYSSMGFEDRLVLDEMHPDKSKEYGKCYGKPRRRTCEFHGSMQLDLLGGEKTNEFKQKRLMEKFNKEIISRFTQRIPPSAKTFYLADRVVFRRYDFDTKQLPLAIDHLYHDWYYDAPRKLALSPEAAERIKSYGIAHNALVKFTLDANGVPRAKEMNVYASDSFKNVILTVPLTYIEK